MGHSLHIFQDCRHNNSRNNLVSLALKWWSSLRTLIFFEGADIGFGLLAGLCLVGLKILNVRYFGKMDIVETVAIVDERTVVSKPS